MTATETPRKREKIRLSIVVPFYNEEDTFEEFYRHLMKALEGVGGPFQVVFVDDGSSDGTFLKMKKARGGNRSLIIVRLRKNFGQSAALAAGFDHATGNIIISMDGDMQHDPSEIPRFIDKIEEGYDIVSGWREKRIDNLFLRRIPSRLANRLMAAISGVRIHDFGTTFKAYRREIIENMVIYRGFHRFLPALASAMGVSIAEISIHNTLRTAGKSKYGIFRTFAVIFDILSINFFLKFMAKPLYIFGSLGLFFLLIGGAGIMGISVVWLFFGVSLRDWLGTFLFCMLATLMGVNFISIGLSSEMTARVYYETQHKKPYCVREVLGSEG